MIDVEVSENTMNKIHAILAGVKDADQKVLKPALTRALMAGKTRASAKARETYKIKKQDFDSRGKLNYNPVSKKGNDLVGDFTFAGAVIPLVKFQVTPSTPIQKKMPSAAVLKSSSLVKFGNEKNVFVAKMKSGHIGIFERQKGKYSESRGSEKNKHTEKLKELMSPAVPTMVGKEEVQKNVNERVLEVLNNRVEHEIDRLLNK